MRMYEDLADLWPLVSPPEDYADEAEIWRRALRDKLGPGRHPILELGVGGGNNLSHLALEFPATAVDLSEQMLAHSKKLNPDVEHRVGDMRTVRLGKTFAAVLVHDAVGYMITESDLRAMYETGAAHTDAGGVMIVAPDWVTENFPGTTVYNHPPRSNGHDELTLIEYVHDPDPSDTWVESVYFFMIKRAGQPLRIEQDRHKLGLFPRQIWMDLMGEAGFEPELVEYPVHEDNREAFLFVGVKRS